MEEEKKEEVKEEIKVEKPKRGTKSKVMTVMLGVTLFCIFSLLLMTIFSDELFFGKKNNSQPAPQKEEQKEEEENQETTTSKINYQVKDSQIYVNNKVVVVKNLIDIDEDEPISISNEKDDIYDLGDLLLVADRRSTVSWFFVDANGNVVGSIGEIVDNVKELVKPKFNVVDVTSVKNNVIYFYNHGYSTQDGYSICEFLPEDKVYYEEKVEYKGNNVFGSPEVISSKTREQVVKEDARFDVDCTNYSD